MLAPILPDHKKNISTGFINSPSDSPSSPTEQSNSKRSFMRRLPSLFKAQKEGCTKENISDSIPMSLCFESVKDKPEKKSNLKPPRPTRSFSLDSNSPEESPTLSPNPSPPSKKNAFSFKSPRVMFGKSKSKSFNIGSKSICKPTPPSTPPTLTPPCTPPTSRSNSIKKINLHRRMLSDGNAPSYDKITNNNQTAHAITLLSHSLKIFNTLLSNHQADIKYKQINELNNNINKLILILKDKSHFIRNKTTMSMTLTLIDNALVFYNKNSLENDSDSMIINCWNIGNNNNNNNKLCRYYYKMLWTNVQDLMDVIFTSNDFIQSTAEGVFKESTIVIV